MSHTKVKTTYEDVGDYGSTDVKTMYCHHNHSSDITSFYYEDGTPVEMIFMDFSPGKDKWDAVMKLNFPFVDEWGKELKESVSYYSGTPWNDKNK